MSAVQSFFLPIKPSKQAVTVFLKYIAFVMAVVFMAIFMAKANALLRSPHANFDIGFIFDAFAQTLIAFHAWLFAIALAYIISVFTVRGAFLNVFVLVAFAIVLQNGWSFLSKVIDVADAKFTIYEINVLQDADKLDESFNTFNQVVPEAQPFILEAIALNPFTPARTLDKMIKVNEALIGNQLQSLYYFQPNNPRGSSVKSLIAKHPHASSEVLSTLAESTSKEVLMEVAANPRTPKRVLQNLQHNAYSEVSAQSTTNLEKNAKK